MNILTLITIILIFPLVALLNFLIVKHIINKAVRKSIQPRLLDLGLELKDYKWLDLFDQGMFRNERFALRPSLKNGNSTMSLYVDVLYLKDGNIKKVTVQIDTMLLFIRRITYSNDL